MKPSLCGGIAFNPDDDGIGVISGGGGIHDALQPDCLMLTSGDVSNRERIDDAPEQMLRWHRIGKKPVKGLIRRRAAEAMLFVS